MEKDFVKPLLTWYDAHHRDLPWRHTKDPYRIWVSEIMLQQTRVEAVKDYYRRFLSALPDLPGLASCPDDELLKLWEGLGYYSRVRNMKKCASLLISDYGGRMPESAEELKKLPGIGPYTAGAIASIAFGEIVPAVDGNVLRVYARMEDLRENILDPKFRKKAESDIARIMKTCVEESARFGGDQNMQVGESVRSDRHQNGQEAISGAEAAGSGGFDPGTFNQAVIELGATLCGPDRAPDCENCPVSAFCLSKRHGTTADLPVRIRESKRKVEHRTVLLIHDGDEIAVRKRQDTGLLAGMYEFPNPAGTLSEEKALSFVRDLGYEPLYIRKMPEAKHLFSHIEWRMTGYEIRIADRHVRVKEEDGAAGGLIFADRQTLETTKAIPSAFGFYAREIALRIGKDRRKDS